jgi:ABC-type nitrate/sulfonate/bicarbonate transport system substrate-binding protein
MAYLTNEPFLVEADGFTPVTLSFAENGLPLASETFVVSRSALAEDREKFKAFLTAEIKGWNDAVADPEGGAKLAVETYGKDLGLKLAGQLEQLEAQNELVVSPDTEANGLLTLTDELIGEIIAALAALDITITAEDLFDMSLLSEIYAAQPDLIRG